MIVVENLSSKKLHDVSMVIEGITCVLGDWDKDKEQLVSALLGKTKFEGKVFKYPEGTLRREQVRVIPREMERINVKASQFLKYLARKYGGNCEAIMSFLQIEDKKMTEMGDLELFKVYLAQAFMGKVSLIISEDFLELFEEQAKVKAIKYLVKTANLVKSSLLLFTSSAEYLDFCNRTYVIYGGRVLEEGKRELFHPYAVTLRNSAISLGKPMERLEVIEIGKPSERGCPFHEYCYATKNNKELFKKCLMHMPPMFAKDGNKVACWLYEG
ncbi:MAG: hypothetical protein TQ35_0005535 [Candidatus Aramenus sulfurataquae]|jgi:ABC-type multidrug transport system ATPase subunit|nr:hypothetical protein [Candidatus Aramenus sulfurataquae]